MRNDDTAAKAGAILERWFAQAVEAYGEPSVQFLGGEKDRFRNPVGHSLRENLAILVRELLGSMDAAKIQAALAEVIRLRAVQDLPVSQAAGFLFLLRPIVREAMPEADWLPLDGRIDQLALLAFEEYLRCRERLAEIRLNEGRRATGGAAWRSGARSR